MSLRSAKTICLRAPAQTRAYVKRLADRLRARGHRVRIVSAPAQQTPVGVDWLLYFERIIYRSRVESFAIEAPRDDGARDASCDLVVDLAGAAPDDDIPVLRLIFDGDAGESGLVSSLLAQRAPVLDLLVTQEGQAARRVGHTRLAVEQPSSLGVALDSVTARLATLVAQAVEGLDRSDAAPMLAQSAAYASAFAFGASGLHARLMHRIAQLVARPDCWHIAVRTIDDDGVMERCDWSGPGWRAVRDDGRRYYADPFIVASRGRRWLFCEEFPHATGKGVLSVAEIADDGQVGTPRPCLETTAHLSWPNVFAHDGAIYMIPESVGAGCVQLWRATDFPYRWTLDRVLIENVRAHDPVLHWTERGVVMIATLDGDGGSSWDALGVFHAPDLFGRWEPHPANPLLVDASSARAAGPIVTRGAELWRAVQDCRGGYGAGLALCRIMRLDEHGFAQDVVARLASPPGTDARGVHTLSRHGSLEAIDLLAPRRAFLRA